MAAGFSKTTREHTAEATKNWMSENEIRVIDWPPYSPDLSPIENVWAVLKYRLCKEECKTFAELKGAILEFLSPFNADFKFIYANDGVANRTLHSVER